MREEIPTAGHAQRAVYRTSLQQGQKVALRTSLTCDVTCADMPSRRPVGLQKQKPRQLLFMIMGIQISFTSHTHCSPPASIPISLSFHVSNIGSRRAVTQNPVCGSTAKSQGEGKGQAILLSLPGVTHHGISRDAWKLYPSDGGTDKKANNGERCGLKTVFAITRGNCLGKTKGRFEKFD